MSNLSQTIITDKSGRAYRIVQETAYHIDTPDRIINLLEWARRENIRIKVTYGDLKTGKPWGDVLACYVGRSAGSIRMPLVINDRRSIGGCGLLDHCIIKLEYSNKKNGTRPLWDVVGRGYSENA